MHRTAKQNQALKPIKRLNQIPNLSTLQLTPESSQSHGTVEERQSLPARKSVQFPALAWTCTTPQGLHKPLNQ